MFHEETHFYSSDDMNNLRMGPSPAVSRYHQQHRFVIQNNTPNLWDHDRLHLKKTTYGLAALVLRAAKFTSSSGQTHANYLLPILAAQVKEGKMVTFVKVDNGSNWSVRSVINSIYLCHL